MYVCLTIWSYALSTLEQIYASIMGKDWRENVFLPSMGVFLSSQLHDEYDEYRWSFYAKVSDAGYEVSKLP